jgi:hypothetical protein
MLRNCFEVWHAYDPSEDEVDNAYREIERVNSKSLDVALAKLIIAKGPSDQLTS